MGSSTQSLFPSYEQLIASPYPTLSGLFEFLNLDNQHVPMLVPAIRAKPLGKWRSYAPDSWFIAQEESAEQLLNEFLGSQTAPHSSTQKTVL